VSQDKDVFRAAGGKNNLVNNNVVIDGGEYPVAINFATISLPHRETNPIYASWNLFAKLVAL
jgi:hypothetical protein